MVVTSFKRTMMQTYKETNATRQICSKTNESAVQRETLWAIMHQQRQQVKNRTSPSQPDCFLSSRLLWRPTRTTILMKKISTPAPPQKGNNYKTTNMSLLMTMIRILDWNEKIFSLKSFTLCFCRHRNRVYNLESLIEVCLLSFLFTSTVRI